MAMKNLYQIYHWISVGKYSLSVKSASTSSRLPILCAESQLQVMQYGFNSMIHKQNSSQQN